MRILFLTPQLPHPTDQGTKLRNYHLLRAAAEAGHEVHLLTLSTPQQASPASHHCSKDGSTSMAELERWCRRIVTVPAPPPRGILRRGRDLLSSPVPDLLLRLWSPALRHALQALLTHERYDVVQFEGLEMAGLLPAVRGPATVLDDHNVEFLLQRRAFATDVRQPRRVHAALYSLVQWRRLLRWEARLCQRADAVLAVSERDADMLGRLSGRPVDVVRNGIDLAATPFRAPSETPNPNLLFDGTMSFRPNDDAARWFCARVMPVLRARRPEIRLWIVGRAPSAALVAYNYQPNGVAVTGAVPSVEPYWARAGLYVLPMRMGSGVRFKALEAMARGVPIVSTRLGMEGIGARADHDYLEAEQPREFVTAIERLLDDAALRRRLAANARQTVADHDWSRIAPALQAVYARLATVRRAAD